METGRPSQRWFFLSLICLLISPRLLHASAGTTGASFLNIPVGAVPAAMGSAYTALASNAYAPTSNPGGLGFLKSTELTAQHLSYIQSVRYEHVGLVIPLGRGGSARRGLGLAIQDLGTGDIARTDVHNGLPVTGLGDFSSHWSAYSLSYGQTLGDALALGVTGKVIRASIDDVSASAYAFDLGLFYRTNEKTILAATVVNLGSPLKFLNEENDLPLAGHVGAAYQANRYWLFSAEGAYRKSGPASAHVGSEWRPASSLSLRLGYKTDTLKGLSATAGFTLGVGLHAWGQELAYAWTPYDELGDAQYLSLLIRFGPSDTRNLAGGAQ